MAIGGACCSAGARDSEPGQVEGQVTGAEQEVRAEFILLPPVSLTALRAACSGHRPSPALPSASSGVPGSIHGVRGAGHPARHYQATALKPVTPGNGVNVSPFITPTRPPPAVSLVPIAILPVELTQYREMPVGAWPLKWTRPAT